MKKLLLIIYFILLSFVVYGQSNKDIIIGTIESIESKILNEQREIWIHVPQKVESQTEYPVIYLLDGSYSHFYSVVGIVNHLNSSNFNFVLPRMIVVGIPNTNRTRDLTPFKGDSLLSPEILAVSGGGENFIAFIEKELIPYIESKYSVAPYKIFIGHSFGGLTVLNTLLHHTELFNAYVAVDPSVQWGRSRILKEFTSSSPNKIYNNITLYMGIANIKTGDDLSPHTKAIFELDKYLKENPQNKLKYASKFYENEVHQTVPLLTEYDAFHFIFDFYDLRLSSNDFDDPNVKLVEKIQSHYKNIFQKIGCEVKPEESFINDLGYKCLGKNNLKKPEICFN